MTSGQRGRSLVTRELKQEDGSLPEFVAELLARGPALLRVPATAVFLNRSKQTTRGWWRTTSGTTTTGSRWR